MTHPGPGPTEEPVVPEETQPVAAEVPPRRSGRRRGMAVGVVVAVVVLIGAGVGTWVAVGHSEAPGSASPQAAVEQLLADVGNDDLIGVVNDLPPAEAPLLRTTLDDANNQLKRIGAVKRNVTAQGAGGITMRTNGIRFDSSAVDQVNDHLAIAKLVAGTITIGTKLSAANYTGTFLHDAFPGGLTNPTGTTTLDIGRQARRLGHPVRIATVKVDGRWYPSLFYSIADSTLQNLHQPWPATAIPAVGADIPHEAAEDFLQAVLNGDAKGAVEHTEPNEMAALHDMGQGLVKAIHSNPADHVRIIRVVFDAKLVPGGVDAVVKKITFVTHGQQVVIQRTGPCYTMETAGKQTSLCEGDFAAAVRGTPLDGVVPASAMNLVNDMFGGLARKGVGIVTTKSRELWYVNPGLTVSQFARDAGGAVKERDLAEALRLMSQAE